MVHRGNTGLSSLLPWESVSYQGTILCRTETGDGLVESGTAKHPNVIKVDVEGFEVNVLRGLSTCLSNERLSTVILEGPPDLPASPAADVLRGCGLGRLVPLGDRCNWMATRS